MQIRLVNSNDLHEGRVEVFYDGEWGTVCDDYWDDLDATVVCRSLGYRSGEAAVNNEYGEGNGRIWLDDVMCMGGETSLASCGHSQWGVHNCFHYEDAGVICSSSKYISMV